MKQIKQLCIKLKFAQPVDSYEEAAKREKEIFLSATGSESEEPTKVSKRKIKHKSTFEENDSCEY